MCKIKPSCWWHVWAWFVDDGVDIQIWVNIGSNKISKIFCHIDDIFEHVSRPYSGKCRYTESDTYYTRSHNELPIVHLIKKYI